MRIFTQTPTRVSLLGGGTDLPVFSDKYGGVVLSMAINLRQLMAFDTENTSTPLMPENGSETFYKAFLEEFKLPNCSYNCISDVPIQSGLGASASAAVGLTASLAQITGKKLTRTQIAEKAWDIEVNKLGLYGGKQDQYAASYGGLNLITFDQDGKVLVSPIDRKKAEFWEQRILLFFTGSVREKPNIQDKLKELSDEQIAALQKIKECTMEAHIDINELRVASLGKLMQDAWEAKKKSNPLVTTPHIDELYEAGMNAGALGGKLLGSGGGGFMAFLVDLPQQEAVKKALQELGAIWYDFSIDWNGVQTRILP